MENRKRLQEERLRRGRELRGRCSIRANFRRHTHQKRPPLLPGSRNALNAAGMKTIGEVRETSDDTLLSWDLQGSIAHLRKSLAFPRPTGSDLGQKALIW